MYEKLTELIAAGEYNEALYEFQDEYLWINERTDAEAAQLCILEASIWEGLGDGPAMYDAISKGLSYNNTNYELYYMLGLYYRDINVNQAYLCMEMALFYCEDTGDRLTISASLDEIRERGGFSVRNVSIMILSYNDLELLQRCIRSIEETVPGGCYEVVVVDNASTENGVVDFLRSAKEKADYNFELIESSDNLGFPKGCNLGYKACNPENDVFFLNNDACLMPGALFYLRMGLYDNRNVGAVGPLSNSASLQEFDMKELLEYLDTKETTGAEERDALKSSISTGTNNWHKKIGYEKAIEIVEGFSHKRSIPLRNPYYATFRLTGFALLIAQDAIEAVLENGNVFDEVYSPGYFEDDDLGIRIARAGYKQFICKNSFVYHNGGGGFEGHNDAMERGRQRFIDKWGFDIWGYCLPWVEACEKAVAYGMNNNGRVRIIDYSCGLGSNASFIKSVVPNAYVAGVCSCAFEVGIAKLIADDAVYGERSTVRIPWPEHSFDIAIYEEGSVAKGQIQRCLVRGGISVNS